MNQQHNPLHSEETYLHDENELRNTDKRKKFNSSSGKIYSATNHSFEDNDTLDRENVREEIFISFDQEREIEEDIGRNSPSSDKGVRNLSSSFTQAQSSITHNGGSLEALQDEESNKLFSFRRLSRLFSISGTHNHAASSISIESKSRSSSSLFLCNICDQNKLIASESMAFASCQSEHTFCRPCIAAYTRVQIDNGIKNQPCPMIHDGCHGFASIDEIESLTTTEEFDLFTRLDAEEIVASPIWTPTKLQKTKSSRNAFVQCPNCFVVIAVGKAGNPSYPITTCIASGCGISFCFFHGLTHSADINCLEYAREIIRESKSTFPSKSFSTMSVDTIPSSNEIKHCPSCKTATRKLDSFNSINCSFCRQCWCWLCHGIVDDMHYQPWNVFTGCPAQETTDWESIRLNEDERVRERYDRHRQLYSLMIFCLFLLYSLLRLSVVVVPITAIIICSIIVSIGFAPFFGLYGYISRSSESETQCPIPLTRNATLPFSRIDDYFLVPSVYCTSILLVIYSCGLFLVWCPIGASILAATSRSESGRASVLRTYQHLIGSAISFSASETTEFILWPLGLPKYILSSLFET